MRASFFASLFFIACLFAGNAFAVTVDAVIQYGPLYDPDKGTMDTITFTSQDGKELDRMFREWTQEKKAAGSKIHIVTINESVEKRVVVFYESTSKTTQQKEKQPEKKK